jgi:hypothetical protein
MPTADWITERLSALPANVPQRGQPDGEDLVVQFGDGPAIRMTVVALAQTGILSIARVVDGGLAREHDGRPRLYATPTLQPALRERMAAARLSWIERGGAIHLDMGPYYIHDLQTIITPDLGKHGDQVTDRKSADADRPARLIGRSGVCAEGLILWWLAARDTAHPLPPLAQTSLADATGVTAPLAGRVLHRLEALGALTPERSGKRTTAWRIANVETILQTWVDEDRGPVRTTRAYVYARHPGELRTRLARMSSTDMPWAIGGVAAANLYTPTLTADPMPTVWLGHDCNPAKAAKSMDGEIVTEGANLVFCQVPKDPWSTFSGGGEAMSDIQPHPTRAHRASWLERYLLELRCSLPISHAEQPVQMISPVRALQQAMQDGKGRSGDVALALSDRLGIASVQTRGQEA